MRQCLTGNEAMSCSPLLALLEAQCKHNLALLKAQCKHNMALLKAHYKEGGGGEIRGLRPPPAKTPELVLKNITGAKHIFDTLQSLYDHSCTSTSLCPVQQNTFMMKDIVSTQHCHEQINKCCRDLTAAAPL